MPIGVTTLRAARLASVAFLATFLLSSVGVAAEHQGCEGTGEYSYICGPQSAEDLVLVPGTSWVIASGFSGPVSLYFIDSGTKIPIDLYPGKEPRARQDMAVFGDCPGSPDPNGFLAHGLNIRAGNDGHSILYVVGHGDREAIEVFDVDATGEAPLLTWTGCVMTPDGMAANSVASLADGSLLVTIPLHTGVPISEAFVGNATGAVYGWSPGDTGFIKVEGTELPYANGIEVAEDGQEFYVASSGMQKILAFSNSNPARLLRSGEELSFIPDNLHQGSGGRLLTAGLEIDDPECGNALEFDLEAFASCPRPFTVLAVDPKSLQGSVLAHSPAHAYFSNVTMALEVGEELWIGSFAGDRIAYRTSDQDAE